MKRTFAPTRIFVVIGTLSGGAAPPAALVGQTAPELDYTAPRMAAWPAPYSQLLLVDGLIIMDRSNRDLGHGLMGRGNRSRAAVGNWYGGRSATPYLVAGTLGLAAPTEGSRGVARGFATFAFAFAAAVDEATSGWIPAMVAYGLATVTALARVRSDAHWFSDVVAGALAGSWVGAAVTARILEGFGLRGEAPAITHPGTGPEEFDPGLVPPRSRVQPVLVTGYIGLRWRF